MQLFSADAKIFLPIKTAYFTAQFSFQYCQPAPNQPKSHILFHKNGSLHDFFIMTLIAATKKNVAVCHARWSETD